MDPTFLIKIIVEAHNRVGTALDQAASSIDRVTKASDKQTVAQKKVVKTQEETKKSIGELQTSYATFLKEIEKGNKTYDDQVFHLKRFQQEFDKLARKQKPGTQQAEELNRASLATKRLLEQVANAEKERMRQVEAAYKQAADVEKAYQELDRRRVASERQAAENRKRLVLEIVEAARSAESTKTNITDDETKRSVSAEQDAINKRKKVVLDLLDTVRGAEGSKGNITDDAAKRTVASEQAAIEQRKKFVSDLVDHVRTEDTRRERLARQLADFEVKEAARVEAIRSTSRVDRDRLGIHMVGQDAQQATGRVSQFVSSLHEMLSVDSTRMERMQSAIEDVDKGLGRGSYSAIRFAGTLRSLVYVGAFVFFQELAGAAVALAGALTAMAASAIQAGAALAGMATTAAAQALPVIGLLGAAWGRVGAVFRAVQQQQKNQVQAAFNQAQAADRSRAAADAVAAAQDGLTAANERAVEAQQALDKARADGVRQVEDLIAAERRAELQAEAAVLKQRDAATAFGTALRTGDVGNLAARSLDVRDANLSTGEAQTSYFRARADRQAIGGDVGNLASVIAAEKAVKQASKGIADATKQLAGARENAAQTVQQISTGARLLEQMLAQLSPAERRLYTAINKLYQRYRDVFIGDAKHTGILGSIIDAFTHGAERITELLGDSRIIGAARSLADEIGKQIKRGIDSITNDDNISFVARMAEQARQNLPTFMSIAGNILAVLRNIADAASGPFKDFLKFIDDLTTGAAKATSGKSGIARLREFFERGEQYAESFTKLGIAIAGLVLAIIGGSAQEGQGAIDSITSSIKEATGWINDHQAEVHQFFSDAIDASAAIAHAAGELSKALFGLFQEEHVKAFAQAFEKTLLPALVTTTKVVGGVTQGFLDLAGTQAGSALFQFLITLGLLSKVFGALGGFILRFGRDIALFFGRERLVGVFNTLLRVLGPTRLALAFIVSAIAVLSGRVNDLGDAIKNVAGLLAGMLGLLYGRRGLVAGVGVLTKGLEGLAASSLLTKLGPLGSFFATMLSNVVAIIRKLPGLRGAAAATGAGGIPVIGTGPQAQARRTAAAAERQAVTTGARRVVIDAGAGAVGAGTAARLGAGAATKLVAPLAILTGLITYLTANGDVFDRLRSVASAFTLGLVPGPATPKVATDQAQQERLSKLGGNFARLGRPTTGQKVDPASLSYIPGSKQTTPGLSRGEVQAAFKAALSGDKAGDTVPLIQLLGENWSKIPKEQLKELADAFDKISKPIDQARDVLSKFKNSLKDINLANIVDPKDAAKFLSNLQQMRRYGLTTIDDLRKRLELGFELISTGFAKGSEDWARAISQNFGAGIQALKDNLDAGKGNVNKQMREIARIARQQMRFVRDNIDELSQDAKNRLNQNFAAAREAIERQTGGWEKATGKALKRIRELMRDQLELYGISPEQARNIAKGNRRTGEQFGDVNNNLGREGGAFRAVGGFVGNMGERGADKVRTFLGRGEAVLNWAHQRVVDPALQAMYGFGLDGVFKRTRSEHAGGGAPGMAAGGRAGAGNVFDGHPSNVSSFVRNLIETMKSKFPLVVTSTTDHKRLTSSGNVSDHVLGRAVDLGGDTSVMYRAAEWIKSSGLYKKLKQGIHNPNLAVNLGRLQTPPGQFAGDVWAQHASHLHLAIVESVGKLAKGLGSAIKRVMVDGPGGGGVFGRISQGAVDMVRKAANSTLEAVSQSTTASSDDTAGIPTFSGGWVKVMEKIASQLHWSLADWKWVVGHESGGRVSIKNPNSTAFGLGQLLDTTYAKYGGGPGSTGAEQIRAMASYIKERYVDPTRAKAFWMGHNWYAKGGEVAGKVGQAVPIVAHAGEWVVNKLQQSKIAGLLGTSVQSLRGNLGFSGGEGSYAGGGEVKAKPYKPPGFIGSDVGDVLGEIRRADSIIERLKTGVINWKLTDALSQTFASLLGDGGLFDQLNDAIAAYADTLSRNLARATYTVDEAGNVIKRLSSQEIADKTVINLKRVYQKLQEQQFGLEQELGAVAERLADPSISKGERNYLKSVQKNLQKRLNTIRDSIAENLSSTFQAIEDAIAEQVSRASANQQKATFGVGLAERARGILGDDASAAFGLPSPGQIAQVRAASLQAQAEATAIAANDALRAGHRDTYEALSQTVGDLVGQVQEAIKAGLEGDAQVINARAGRGLAQVGLSNRMADLIEASGNTAGAFAQRGSNLQTQGNILTGQRDNLGSLLYTALEQGQFGVADALAAQIDELNVQLAENEAAIKDNTAAARAAAVADILKRSGFLGSVYSGLQGILTGLGQLTGATDVPGQRTLLGLQQTNLTSTGSSLADQLLPYGIDIRGQSPAQIAATLARTNFAAIESNMTVAERSAFEDLVGAVISNTGAIVDNSNALAQLNGSLSQSFSSTAWQTFRTAIFNGSGALLPQYQYTVPSAATGAFIRKGGMLEVHANEIIGPADIIQGVPGNGGPDTGITNVYVTHPVERFDAVDASRQLAFHRKHGGP